MIMRKLRYWNDHRPTHKVIGESKKGPSENKGHFRYKDYDDPNHRKLYGSIYTERQLAILNGDIPWETTPLKQISLLVNKAKALGDEATYIKARYLQNLKRTQGRYVPELTPGEAKDILKRLTPERK